MELDQRRLEVLYRWQNGDTVSAIAQALGLSSRRVYQLCVSTLNMLADPEVCQSPLRRVLHQDLLP